MFFALRKVGIFRYYAFFTDDIKRYPACVFFFIYPAIWSIVLGKIEVKSTDKYKRTSQQVYCHFQCIEDRKPRVTTKVTRTKHW